MDAKDIDKLFKERLGNAAPTPPADLWNRLQERMQEEAQDKEEATKVIAISSEKKKTGFLWLYSSVAAAVTLVLSVGVLFYNIQTGTPEVHEVLADKSRPFELHEKPVTPQEVPATMAQTETISSEENKLIPQATDATPPASTRSEAVKTQQALAKAVVRKAAKAETETVKPKAQVQQAYAKQKTENKVADPETSVTSAPAMAKADANLNAAPVEIIITRAVAAKPAQAVEADAEPAPVKDNKSQLAKNIFKQVRGLATGKSVELSELGINADKVALHAQIGNQKFTKVINL